MKVLPEIGEISVSNDLWDGKNESKILRQFLMKVRKRLGISLSVSTSFLCQVMLVLVCHSH
jgi:hypothetical protein